MERIQKAIEGHPFFAGMEPSHIQTLMSCASEYRAHINETIAKEGDVADAFYIVLSGEVQLEVFMLQPGSIPIQTLEPGDVLGWSWLIPPYRWRFDARATKTTELIAVDAEKLRGLIVDQPELAYDLLLRFAMLMDDRLRATREKLVNSYAGKW